MIRELMLKKQEMTNVPNCIYEKYKCSCEKYWKGENKIIVYFLDENNCMNLIDEYTENVFAYVSKIINIVNDKFINKGNLLIAGGHTVINLKDRNFASEEMLDSTMFSMDLIKGLYCNFNQIDFMIPLNDFFMEKDFENRDSKMNYFREMALNPYIIPDKIRVILEKYAKFFDYGIFYCSEKNMADKFKRHIKNIKKKDSNIFNNYGSNLENWSYILNNKEIEVISNNKPNCAAGNAATFRDINYIVNNKKISKNYDYHIGIYPLCSVKNVIDGYLVGRDFYKLRLPTLLVFFDKKCF